MRVFACAVIGLFAVAMTASAQENLDTVLKGWEKSMTELRSFVSVVERSTFDKALNAHDEHKGYAMFMKAATKNDGSRARLEMAKVGKPEVFEKYICTGTFLYEYVPANKLIRIHNMPNNKQGGMQESFLSFLFGMGAEEAKKRYDMNIEYPEDRKTKKKYQDKNYHYILIRPRTAQDKSDFVEARLSLLRSNNLPAQIWYLQPNKSEITWNFKEHQLNVQIPLTYFQPDRPKDWREERVMPAKVAPVIRN